MSKCELCDSNREGKFVACDRCDKWFHCSCCELTDEEIDQVVNFFCPGCETEKLFTTWKRKKATREQRIDKSKNYYDVGAILDDKERNGKRFFKVAWKNGPGISETAARKCTWEPEKNLDGAIDLLQLYCRLGKIPLSKIDGLLGADIEKISESNRSNWISMNTLLENFAKLRSNLSIKVNLEAKHFTHFEQKDGLYFLDFQFHCFVLLYIHERQLAYIADGGNVFRENDRIANGVKEFLKIRLISLPFDQQLGVDHCGSSAILIGIKLLRMYRYNIKFQRLITNKSTRNQLIKTLHPSKSKPMNLPVIGKREKRLSCPMCSKTYVINQRQSLNMHIARVHSRKQ